VVRKNLHGPTQKRARCGSPDEALAAVPIWLVNLMAIAILEGRVTGATLRWRTQSSRESTDRHCCSNERKDRRRGFRAILVGHRAQPSFQATGRERTRIRAGDGATFPLDAGTLYLRFPRKYRVITVLPTPNPMTA